MKNALSALGLIAMLYILSRDKSMGALALIVIIGTVYFVLRMLKDYIIKRKKGVDSNDRDQ